ncbi:MAG: NAD-dependent epimerase/dehydratase family protein [Candidatus Omnitrophica bacterium]|nr:NAD-dependent epimerase/dehydratase family protein [Candidatus Omnitrophota bacterium]
MRSADKKRVYLISGASGFVGACLLRRLVDSNAEVHVLLRPKYKGWRLEDLAGKYTAHTSDLSDARELTVLAERIRPTVIYHLAAYGAYAAQNDAAQCIQTNVQGTWNLLKATAGIEYELFVNTGSSSEYGFKKAPMKEDDALDPASYYAVTKGAQTALCRQFAREYAKPVVTLRPFSVYGPYEEPGRFIPTLLLSLLLRREMNLVSPDIRRDWIYIDDMIDAYLCIDRLKCHGGEVFNAGTGHQASIRDVAELAAVVTGETPLYKWGAMQDRRWDTDFWVADTTKAGHMLEWSSKVGLQDGLLRTWAWLKNNKHRYM